MSAAFQTMVFKLQYSIAIGGGMMDRSKPIAGSEVQARFIIDSVESVEGITDQDLHGAAVQRRAARRVADEMQREEEALAFMQAGERVHGASFRREER